MANNDQYYFLFSLCETKNKFVFEVTDLFGSILTVEEIEYWMVYNIVSRAKYYGVDYSALPMEEVIKMIDAKVEEKKRTYAKSGFKQK